MTKWAQSANFMRESVKSERPLVLILLNSMALEFMHQFQNEASSIKNLPTTQI